MRAWKRSGLSCKAFAAREGLKATTLSWWSWQLRKRDGGDHAVGPDPVSFIEVGGLAGREEPFIVELSRPITIRVPPSFDATALGSLLELLERRA